MKRMMCGFFVCLSIVGGCSKSSDNKNNADDNLNASDSMFLIKASYGNYGEVSAGSIADSLGSQDSVKMFGEMMIIHHSTAQLSLDSIGTQSNIALPTAADTPHQATASMLRMLSGKTFDSTYLAKQVADHQATQNLYQNELNNGQNTRVLEYTNRVLLMVNMHLAMAQELLSKE